MARTERFRRKDLFQPDEFVTLSRRAIAYADTNRTLVLGIVGGALLVLIAVVAYATISASRESAAAAAYHRAHTLLADEKYAEAADAFANVAETYGSTDIAVLARLEAANALLLAESPAEAVLHYERFLAAGPPADYLRQLALTRLAFANEQRGNVAEAQASYAAAVGLPGPLADEALLGEARTAMAGGDTAKARELYERFLEEYPTSYRAPTVRLRLRELGAPAAVAADSAAPAPSGAAATDAPDDAPEATAGEGATGQ